MPSNELAAFLRSRRAAFSAHALGSPLGPRRRTPGLRREEVADRAHMSVDYYTRLEQARGPRPSARILESLAGALALSSAERSHLYRLAAVTPDAPPGPPRTVRPHITALLHRLPDTAVIVTAADYQVLAWNPLAAALLDGLADLESAGAAAPNLARRHFLEPATARSSDHEEFGTYAVARLRAAAARYPHDPDLAALLAELRSGCSEFAEIWATNPVRAPGHRTKSLQHPELGRLSVNCDVVALAEDDQQIVFVTADAGTPTERALRSLARNG